MSNLSNCVGIVHDAFERIKRSARLQRNPELAVDPVSATQN
ncbi:MAG TPA: hypothetical protein VFA43_12535 [Gemmatimonadaceae bacterium]|nr:hypothetical protein [Gemmatimonadaceae bacterium]